MNIKSKVGYGKQVKEGIWFPLGVVGEEERELREIKSSISKCHIEIPCDLKGNNHPLLETLYPIIACL